MRRKRSALVHFVSAFVHLVGEGIGPPQKCLPKATPERISAIFVCPLWVRSGQDLPRFIVDCANYSSIVLPQNFHDFQKLNQINPALTALVFRNKGLRTIEFSRQLYLRKTSRLSRRNKTFAKGFVSRRMGRFPHYCAWT